MDPPNPQHKTQLPPPHTQSCVILHREPHRIAFRRTRTQIIWIRQRAVGELGVAMSYLAGHVQLEVDGRRVLRALGPDAARDAGVFGHHVEFHGGDAPLFGCCAGAE